MGTPVSDTETTRGDPPRWPREKTPTLVTGSGRHDVSKHHPCKVNRLVPFGESPGPDSRDNSGPTPDPGHTPSPTHPPWARTSKTPRDRSGPGGLPTSVTGPRARYQGPGSTDTVFIEPPRVHGTVPSDHRQTPVRTTCGSETPCLRISGCLRTVEGRVAPGGHPLVIEKYGRRV